MKIKEHIFPFTFFVGTLFLFLFLHDFPLQYERIYRFAITVSNAIYRGLNGQQGIVLFVYVLIGTLIVSGLAGLYLVLRKGLTLTKKKKDLCPVFLSIPLVIIAAGSALWKWNTTQWIDYIYIGVIFFAIPLVYGFMLLKKNSNLSKNKDDNNKMIYLLFLLIQIALGSGIFAFYANYRIPNDQLISIGYIYYLTLYIIHHRLIFNQVKNNDNNNPGFPKNKYLWLLLSVIPILLFLFDSKVGYWIAVLITMFMWVYFGVKMIDNLSKKTSEGVGPKTSKYRPSNETHIDHLTVKEQILYDRARMIFADQIRDETDYSRIKNILDDYVFSELFENKVIGNTAYNKNEIYIRKKRDRLYDIKAELLHNYETVYELYTDLIRHQLLDFNNESEKQFFRSIFAYFYIVSVHEQSFPDEKLKEIFVEVDHRMSVNYKSIDDDPNHRPGENVFLTVLFTSTVLTILFYLVYLMIPFGSVRFVHRIQIGLIR